MKQVQRGFTLIELVMVIVILGVLAAVALPRFVDLRGEAGDAAANGVAGALSSASTMNYGQRVASNNVRGTQITATTTCAGLEPLMVGGVLSSDGQVSFVSSTATLGSCTSVGAVDQHCFVKHANGLNTTGYTVTAICG